MTEDTVDMRQPRHISPLQIGVIAAGVALIAAAFWSTGEWMIKQWDKEASYYSHGWLVPIVTAVLIWRVREKLAACRIAPCRWGWALLIASLLAHLAGAGTATGFATGFAFVGVLMGLVLLFLGKDVLRTVFFPLLFLAFMVPLPQESVLDAASFEMKMKAAQAAGMAVEGMGFVIARDGSIIHLPASEYVPHFQRLIVDDVCSGLKYLISLTAFGALYAYIAKVRAWGKWLLFLVSIPISFVANVIRVILMILVAIRWGVEQVEQWYFHDLFGILLFVFAFVFLFIVEELLLKAKWAKPENDDDSASEDVKKPAPPPMRQRPAMRAQAGVLAILAVVATASLLFYFTEPPVSSSGVLAEIPQSIGQWQGLEGAISEREKEILGTEDILCVNYSAPGHRQARLLIVIAHQSRRRSHPPEKCFKGEGYYCESTRVQSLDMPIGKGESLRVRELLYEKSSEKRLVWYFFKNGPDFGTSYFGHQFKVAIARFTGQQASDVLIRVDAPLANGNIEETRTNLRDFLTIMLPHLIDKLP